MAQVDANKPIFDPREYFLLIFRYQPNDEKKTCDWSQRATELLSELINNLSELIEAWKSFADQNGDICYFSDFCSATSRDFAYERLRSIKEMFDELLTLRRKLTKLQDSCRNWTKDVSQSRTVLFAIAFSQISSANDSS